MGADWMPSYGSHMSSTSRPSRNETHPLKNGHSVIEICDGKEMLIPFGRGNPSPRVGNVIEGGLELS